MTSVDKPQRRDTLDQFRSSFLWGDLIAWVVQSASARVGSGYVRSVLNREATDRGRSR